MRPALLRALLGLACLAFSGRRALAEEFHIPRRESFWAQSESLGRPRPWDFGWEPLARENPQPAFQMSALQSPPSRFEKSFVVRVASFFIHDEPAGGIGDWCFKFHIILE